MRCPECRFENREEDKFCKKCCAKLELACPKCNSVLTPDIIFCGKYGLLTDQAQAVFAKV